MDGDVSDTDSEDLRQIQEMDDVAERLHNTNPWIRDDNQYTWEMVSQMTRPEFERRRELHVIYGTSDPDVEINDPDAYEYRVLGAHGSLNEYINHKYRPLSMRHPHVHIVNDLFNDQIFNRNVHIRRAHHVLVDREHAVTFDRHVVAPDPRAGCAPCP